MEVVLTDHPAVVGPATKTKPICLECLKGPLEENECFRCQKCNFPLCDICGKNENERKLHTKRECDTLRKCSQIAKVNTT